MDDNDCDEFDPRVPQERVEPFWLFRTNAGSIAFMLLIAAAYFAIVKLT